MSNKYAHLLTPLRVGDIYLKNRLFSSPYNFHFIQGPEDYPSQALINHFIDKAKAGAALVTCKGKAASPPNMPEDGKAHVLSLDYTNGPSMHYFSQMTEGIHFYGAKATMLLVPDIPHQYDASSGVSSLAVAGDGSFSVTGIEAPPEMLPTFADQYAKEALIAKQLGFDGVFIHSSYRSKLPARFLSPLTNHRTDEYGGPIENRAKFLLMICDAIKKACGQSFIIEASITGEEPGGTTLEDTAKLALMAEGKIDLMHIKHWDIDLSHPINFELNRNPMLYMAEAIKSQNPKVAIVAAGGFLDLDASEKVLASGKADAIAMARAWITNPNYGQLAYEGRNEDVVPCLRCNKCHRSSDSDPWVDVCSVNPTWGMEERLSRVILPPSTRKKVAVIGGGPAGMKAALTAAERGHRVTLYEKESELGGTLNAIQDIDFKYPIKDFNRYLKGQIAKSAVEVLLNTEAVPEMIAEKRYDVVITALGATPITPGIPGADGKNVLNAKYVYANEGSLGKNVAVIGGGEIGVETGIFLASCGHNVTVIEMKSKLAPDAAPVHFYSMFQSVWEAQPGFHSILNAVCTGITPFGVSYWDSDGAEHTIPADSVVIAAGMRANSDEAISFYAPGDEIYMVGDCMKVGNIQKAIRSAFFRASTF